MNPPKTDQFTLTHRNTHTCTHMYTASIPYTICRLRKSDLTKESKRNTLYHCMGLPGNILGQADDKFRQPSVLYLNYD